MLRIHHLGHSQSERIIWLCEELGLAYELRHCTRDPVTLLSPPELKALHPLGAAPLVEDGDLLLAESAAIVEYIIVKHGGGRRHERVLAHHHASIPAARSGALSEPAPTCNASASGRRIAVRWPGAIRT